MADDRGVQLIDIRHHAEDDDADDTDGQFQQGVNAQRVVPGRNEARQGEAAQAHAAHERAQEHAEGNGGRADCQLQQLEPDNFVNEGRAAAADKRGAVAADIEAKAASTPAGLGLDAVWPFRGSDSWGRPR